METILEQSSTNDHDLRLDTLMNPVIVSLYPTGLSYKYLLPICHLS